MRASHSKPLEGVQVTLVASNPARKLSEARTRGTIRFLNTAGTRINLISFLPYSNRFAIEREKPDELLSSITMHFPARWPRFLKGLLLLAFNFVYTLKYARKSQIVFAACGQMTPNMPVIIASKLLRKPLIYDWLDLEITIPELFFKYLVRQAHTVLGLSFYLCEKARSYGCKNVVYTPCFVDVNHFQIDGEARKRVRNSWGVKRDNIVIGYSGVLHKGEGVAVLLQAFKGLLTKHKHIRLVILGVVIPTGEWVDVPQLTKDLHLEDTVIIVPPVIHSEVPNILSACDILCAPKLDTDVNRASIPIKVIEYLSMGLPTVTTTVGELNRIVIDKVNGFMAKPGDVGDLEAVLEEIILNPEHSQEVGRRGRVGIVNEFGIDAIENTIVKSLIPILRRK